MKKTYNFGTVIAILTYLVFTMAAISSVFSIDRVDTVISTHKTIVIRWDSDCKTSLIDVTAGNLTDIHINKRHRQAVINHIPKGDTVYITSQWNDYCSLTVDITGAESLPIQLLRFEDGLFETSAEINTWYFEIQVFKSGVIWETIETVYAKGASIYLFGVPGTGYYRMVSYDYDGYNEVFDPIYIESATQGVRNDIIGSIKYGPLDIKYTNYGKKMVSQEGR